MEVDPIQRSEVSAKILTDELPRYSKISVGGDRFDSEPGC